MTAPTENQSNPLGIRGYDYIEFYVGSAKMTAYWHAKSMGFDITGYLGPETGHRDRASYFLTQNKIKLLITSATSPGTHDVQSFVTTHGDGVKRWALEVDCVETAFTKAMENGAIPVRRPNKSTDKSGSIDEAAIRIYDDAEVVFINRDHYKGIFKPGFGPHLQKISLERTSTGLDFVDHIVGNVRENEMNLWATYLNKTLNFETFIEFGPGDISTKFSALLSKVVRSKNSTIKNPINEPYKGVKKSQIDEYIQEYHGSGIQHIAITTPNIIETIRAMRKNGVEFLSVPKTYYELLREKDITLEENIDDLEELGILCDTEGQGYLLQLFTKPIGDRPTFFYEIIQRRQGAEGFGQGNFQSLFESIERDQAKRGNL